MEQENDKQIEALEQDTKYKIIQMEDDVYDKGVLDDTKEEISKLFREFRIWLSDHIDSDEISLRFDKLKKDTTALLEAGKIKCVEFTQREDVQRAKESVVNAGEKVMGSVNEGVHTIMENEYVEKVIDTVNDAITSVANDERIRQGVKKFKKGTLKVAESAVQGLKKVLDTDEDHDEVKKG